MERCTTILLDASDIERAVQDPKLSKMLADGWTVITSAPMDVGTESRPRPSLLLVLAPPIQAQVLTPVVASGWPGWMTVTTAALSGLVAALLVQAIVAGLG